MTVFLQCKMQPRKAKDVIYAVLLDFPATLAVLKICCYVVLGRVIMRDPIYESRKAYCSIIIMYNPRTACSHTVCQAQVTAIQLAVLKKTYSSFELSKRR